MDQRTDTEHRLDAAPGHDNKPAIGEARKTQSWLDRMQRRRRQVLVITALIIAAIVGTVAYWLNASGYESTDDPSSMPARFRSARRSAPPSSMCR